MLGIPKSLTFHLARHSFATLALAHDVPIENVAKMLGHTDIKTTQIYAKILHSTVERHSRALAASIR
jgi:site-specific recombinase XerD